MLINKPYDEKDINSILEYASKLVNKSFRQVIYESSKTFKDNLTIKDPSILDEYNSLKSGNKGNLGQIIEKNYFLKELDNLSIPDFNKVGMELKVTPYKKNKNKSFSSKERLIITMINYHDLIFENFSDSGVLSKLKKILLILYLWEEDKDRLDYIINFIYLFEPSDQDLAIIEDDFNIIKKKVSEGLAHELSEADTMYLGAATKAATSQDRTTQPNSSEVAKPRAFSLKNSYMTQLLRERVMANNNELKILNDKEIIHNFEDFVINKLNKYIGKEESFLINKYQLNANSKGRFKDIVNSIMGVNVDYSSEFLKANIKVKTIRINKNQKIIESMSFESIKFMDFINEQWEDSTFNNMLSESKFLFVIFEESKEGKYVYKKNMFWNMPTKDIEEIVKYEWLNVQRIIKEGVCFNYDFKRNRMSTNLPKLSNTEITHVRNHSSLSYYKVDGVEYGKGKKSRDGDLLPNGDIISKQCFWLNNKYILKQIKK